MFGDIDFDLGDFDIEAVDEPGAEPAARRGLLGRHQNRTIPARRRSHRVGPIFHHLFGVDSDTVMATWTVAKFDLYKRAAEHLLKMKEPHG